MDLYWLFNLIFAYAGYKGMLKPIWVFLLGGTCAMIWAFLSSEGVMVLLLVLTAGVMWVLIFVVGGLSALAFYWIGRIVGKRYRIEEVE